MSGNFLSIAYVEGVMKYITTLVLVLGGLASLTFSSCNTLAGFGQDLQYGGSALQSSAERATN